MQSDIKKVCDLGVHGEKRQHIIAYKNFNQQSSLRTWLVSILRNRIVDHHRKTASKTILRERDLNTDEGDGDFDECGRWREGRGQTEWDLPAGLEIQPK